MKMAATQIHSYLHLIFPCASSSSPLPSVLLSPTCSHSHAPPFIVVDHWGRNPTLLSLRVPRSSLHHSSRPIACFLSHSLPHTLPSISRPSTSIPSRDSLTHNHLQLLDLRPSHLCAPPLLLHNASTSPNNSISFLPHLLLSNPNSKKIHIYYNTIIIYYYNIFIFPKLLKGYYYYYYIN